MNEGPMTKASKIVMTQNGPSRLRSTSPEGMPSQAKRMAAMMMMPIGLGLVIKVDELQGKNPTKSTLNFGACIMLGIAYSANIGQPPAWMK